jgi:hypothetical protein
VRIRGFTVARSDRNAARGWVCRRVDRVFVRKQILAGVCLAVSASAFAQDNRIFVNTPETVAIWEFNGLETDVALPNGTVIADTSGNGHDAIVKGNAGGAVVGGAGDPAYDGANNTTARKSAGAGAAPVGTTGDGSAFELGPDEDFTIELDAKGSPSHDQINVRSIAC